MIFDVICHLVVIAAIATGAWLFQRLCPSFGLPSKKVYVWLGAGLIWFGSLIGPHYVRVTNSQGEVVFSTRIILFAWQNPLRSVETFGNHTCEDTSYTCFGLWSSYMSKSSYCVDCGDFYY